jgi:CRP/FNR family transcriptional regulator
MAVAASRSHHHATLGLHAESLLDGGRGNPADLLTPAQRAHLLGFATRLTLPPRKTIYREGDEARWVFFVAEGAVKACRHLPSGRRRVLAFLFTGDLVGLSRGGRYVNAVQTLSRSVLYRLPREPLLHTLQHDPGLEFHFLCKVIHELRDRERRSLIVGRRDAAGRVAMFLAALAERVPTPAPQVSLSLPMTRTDIADYLAMTPEAVSRSLSRLERDEMIRVEGRHEVHVLSWKRLRALADRL